MGLDRRQEITKHWLDTVGVPATRNIGAMRLKIKGRAVVGTHNIRPTVLRNCIGSGCAGVKQC